MTDSTLPPLIQQMMQPGFYPHPLQKPLEASETSNVLTQALPEFGSDPTSASIQLLQTHVSYVLLAGEFAYKLKKPVNFGFLDYSTLEKRHHFCNEELRLNKRGASDLYLDVLPITQDGDRFSLTGAGQIVDYAVKMRRFPQETLLTSLFEQGLLTEELLQELAKVVAQFHTQSVTNDYIRSFGEVAQVRQAFDENFEQTEQYIGGPQTQAQFDQTRVYCDRFFAEQGSLFVSRMQNNWIRECHGDLHLRNICFWKNQIWLFDCIEFNEPFRFVDVMYDIAYIVMDLESRQRPDLSTLFLNAYVEQTGDWEGLQVLPIYISRQTYVRAKVTSFLLNDAAVSAADKQKATETAALYYQMSWQYAQPRQGQLIFMSGLSGSGKSTIARHLAQRIGAIHIRSDALRKHLGGIPLEQQGDASLYTAEMTEKTYGRLLELGTKLASQGYSVILDAKYDRQPLRAAVIAETKTHKIPLRILYCEAPMTVLRDRLQHRQDISDATADLLPQQHLDPFTEAEQPYLKTLDTTQNLEKQLDSLTESP